MKGRANELPREVAAINVTAHAVREHAATAGVKAAVDHLVLIEQQYLGEARTVPVDQLQHLQGRLAQVAALIQLFKGESNCDGTA